MYILDTNIMTFVTKYPKQYPHLLETIKQTPYEHIWVSVITVEEAIQGAYKLRYNPVREKRGDPQGNAASCYKLLCEIIMGYSKYQILTYDREDMRIFAGFSPEIRRAAQEPDRKIAATAIRHDYTVITQNMSDFRATRAKCLDWTRV